MANIILKNRNGEPVLHENRTSIKLPKQGGGEAIFYENGGSAKDHTFDVPTVDGGNVYTGGSQSPTLIGYYSDFMTLTGATSAIAAGNYTITVSLKDIENCQWRDGTTSSKTISWSIAKANLPKPTISPTSLRFSPSVLTSNFTVSRSGDGLITATSSDPTVISVTVSGSTVTVTALSTVSSQSYTVTVHVSEGTNYNAYEEDDVICSVIVQPSDYSTLTVYTDSAGLTVPLAFRQSALSGVSIDWGDGSLPETAASGSSSSTTEGPRYHSNLSHVYTTSGLHTITITPDTGVTWSFGREYASTSYNVFNIKRTSITSVGAGEPSGVHARSFIGGSGLEYSGVYSFKGTRLESYKVTAMGLTKLQFETFASCSSLLLVELPSTVTELESSSLLGTVSMYVLKVKAVTPPTAYSGTFGSMAPSCRIYVPSESVTAYKEAEFWSSRAAYIYPIT